MVAPNGSIHSYWSVFVTNRKEHRFFGGHPKQTPNPRVPGQWWTEFWHCFFFCILQMLFLSPQWWKRDHSSPSTPCNIAGRYCALGNVCSTFWSTRELFWFHHFYESTSPTLPAPSLFFSKTRIPRLCFCQNIGLDWRDNLCAFLFRFHLNGEWFK